MTLSLDLLVLLRPTRGRCMEYGGAYGQARLILIVGTPASCSQLQTAQGGKCHLCMDSGSAFIEPDARLYCVT